jgi:N-acetylneuraminic acid mutarotase
MLPANNKQNHDRLRVGLIVALVGLIGAITLMLVPARRVAAQAAAPNWSYTGNLNRGRSGHTATLLQNGKVLVAGGSVPGTVVDNFGFLNSAELFDPTTGTWSVTGNLNTTRDGATATLLPNGKVLVAGGWGNCTTNAGCRFLSSTELFDPATGTWSATGNLNTTRIGHTATLLQNGKVLVAAGLINYQSGAILNSAELYDPATGTWSITGSLNAARSDHTATLLPNGRVLVAGGQFSGNELSSAELYDPMTETWSITGNLNENRGGHGATLLQNGKVLVTGNFLSCPNECNDPADAEIYDPATETWSVTGNPESFPQSATLLPSGKVLVSVDGPGNRAELYDPATGTWSETAHRNTARSGFTATLLANGEVLVAGGQACNSNGCFTLNSAELYDPGSNPTTNQIDDAQFFVHQHYLDFLNREPDPNGLAFWTNEITLCGADTQCIEAKRINVSAAFFLSIEFQQTGYLVYRCYKASYGNSPGAPVPIRFNEFLPDTKEIGQGVIVNQNGWEQLLENNKQAFTAEFVQRARFTSAYPTSMTPDVFVNTLFANAGVVPLSGDRTTAINEFGSAATTADNAARARALRRVAENSTLAQQEFNRAFVLMQYFGYLRRNPNDPPEPTLDFQGYNFWLTKLNQFNGNFVNAEMVKAFLVASEYRQRFGP